MKDSTTIMLGYRLAAKKVTLVKEENLPTLVAKLTKGMKQAAKNMEFEHGAELRDEIKEQNKILIEMG